LRSWAETRSATLGGLDGRFGGVACEGRPDCAFGLNAIGGDSQAMRCLLHARADYRV
jgi:hypothetical protein